MAKRKDKVFVYGTLRQGFRYHSYLLRSGARYLGNGRIRGHLYDLGEYPGALSSSSPYDRIEGELFELPDSTKQLKELDRLEEYNPDRPDESLFVRQRTIVQLENGRRVRAWAYFVMKKPQRARLIPSGNYAEAYRSRS